MTTPDNINHDLIKKLEEEISVKNPSYLKQLELATQDFIDYCMPGSVNNWTHPEAPPTHASLVLAAKILKTKSILDIGTGLSGVTFRKYLPETTCTSIDDSFVWINRLRIYLQFLKISTQGLLWYDGQAFNNMATYSNENLDKAYSNFRTIPLDCKSPDGVVGKVDSNFWSEPERMFSFADVSEYSEMYTIKDKLNAHATSQVKGYWLGDSFFNLRHPDNEHILGWSDLGKHSFIHYDFGGMRIRESYLKSTIDLLDRSRDSLLYVDDYHKSDIIYQGKTFKEIAHIALSSQGGILLNCEEALTDDEGAFGALYYFPPEKT